MNSKAIFFAFILLPFLTQALAQENPSDQLPDSMKNFVDWHVAQAQDFYSVDLPTSEKTTAYHQSGYGVVQLIDKHDIEIKQSLVEETVTSAYLYITNSGIENSGNDSFWINIHNQHAEILEAYVLQPDGRRLQVDPSALQFNSDNSSGTFNDYFYVTIPYPQLQQGSISILTYKIRTDKKRSPMPWARIIYPAGFTPVENFSIRASWKSEKWKPVWQTDYPDLNCSEDQFSLICRTQQPSPPFPIEDGMPSAYDLLPTLVLSEPSTWKTISSTMEELSSSALKDNKKVQDFAFTLIKGTKNSPLQRLNHLTDFVAGKVRYVGIEHGSNGLTPKPTRKTLEQRYGDCKDKTMLFVDMARNLGFGAYPVLTSTKRKSLAKLLLPSSLYFNHMIACVGMPTKKEQCVDLTDPDSSVGNLPHYLHGSVMLKIGQGTDKPETLPKERYAWRVSITAHNRFTDQGSIFETLERSYMSHWGAQLRRSLSSKTKQQRDQWLLEDYYNIYTDRVNPDLRVTGLENYGSPLILSSETQFDNIFDPKQLAEYSEYDLWLRNIIPNFKTLGFHYPYEFQGLHYRSEISYLHAEKIIANIGPTINYLSPWGELNRWYDVNGAQLTVLTEVRLPQATIPINKISEFNQFLDLIFQVNRIWFNYPS
ncbi:DUF3857 domain-containing protein [Methylomarinum vadi]|uniref:DUF3857 domain-containing protein n=1 Tax=Methylomarinum vadi TaxID=438855 RepID=UPI0004DF5747|nr:DUF3857 domain-containing protein [Methylomarinum vadi]